MKVIDLIVFLSQQNPEAEVLVDGPCNSHRLEEDQIYHWNADEIAKWGPTPSWGMSRFRTIENPEAGAIVISQN